MAYVLFVTYIDFDGSKETRFYCRRERMWIYAAQYAVGYETVGAAQGQLTRLEKRGFNLHKGANVFEWGVNRVEMAVSK